MKNFVANHNHTYDPVFQTRKEVTALLLHFNIKHFLIDEIIDTLRPLSRPMIIPKIYISNLAIPLIIWDMVREGTGLKIRLTSTYRDEVYNRSPKIKGVRNSMHLIAGGIDGQSIAGKNKTIQEFIEDTHIYIRLDRSRIITKKDLGLGFYPTFTHIDARGKHNRHSPVIWRAT